MTTDRSEPEGEPELGQIDSVPATIGKYRLVQKVGEGAFSRVFFGRDAETLAPVAVKVLREDIDSSIAEQVRVRFLAEEKISKAINHPAIVDILTTSEPAARPCFLAMEFVAGRPFSEHFRRLQRSAERPARQVFLSEVARLSHQVAAAMARGHERGIVHRDLKPDNVLVVCDGEDRLPQVRILDFGIAKAPVELFSVASAPSVTRYWTELGTVMGSQPFMAPEQNGAAHTVTGKADVFALGVMLLVSVFGVEGEALEKAGRGLSLPGDLDRAIAVSPALPKGWESLLRSMLAPDPDKRPAMREVEIVLQRLARTEQAFAIAVEAFIRRGRVPRARQLVQFLNWAESAEYLTDDEVLFLKRAPVRKLKSYRKATISGLLLGGFSFGSAALIASLAWQHDSFVRFKSRVQAQQAKEAQRLADLEQQNRQKAQLASQLARTNVSHEQQLLDLNQQLELERRAHKSAADRAAALSELPEKLEACSKQARAAEGQVAALTAAVQGEQKKLESCRNETDAEAERVLSCRQELATKTSELAESTERLRVCTRSLRDREQATTPASFESGTDR